MYLVQLLRLTGVPYLHSRNYPSETFKNDSNSKVYSLNMPKGGIYNIQPWRI